MRRSKRSKVFISDKLVEVDANWTDEVSDQVAVEDETVELYRWIESFIHGLTEDAVEMSDSKAFVKWLLDQIISKVCLAGFNCDICDKWSRDRHNLNRHMERKHSGEVLCLKCNSVLLDKARFLDHIKDCYFECNLAGCTKKFKEKMKFEAHKRMHMKVLNKMNKYSIK